MKGTTQPQFVMDRLQHACCKLPANPFLQQEHRSPSLCRDKAISLEKCCCPPKMPRRQLEFGEDVGCGDYESDGETTVTTCNTSPATSASSPCSVVAGKEKQNLDRRSSGNSNHSENSKHSNESNHSNESDRGNQTKKTKPKKTTNTPNNKTKKRTSAKSKKSQHHQTLAHPEDDVYCLSPPPPPPRRLLCPDNVVALLHDFYDDLTINKDSKSRECWKAFYEKYHSKEYQMVRPSGNPMQTQGFVEYFCNEEIVLYHLELVSVDDVQILAGGLVAIVICTVDQTFSFRGELQEDRVTLTCILEEVNGDIKIRQEHRSSGRPQPRKVDRWGEELPKPHK